MALQLLLEASAGVSAMKSIESACIFEGQRMTIMTLPHSVVFVNVCLCGFEMTGDIAVLASA